MILNIEIYVFPKSLCFFFVFAISCSLFVFGRINSEEVGEILKVHVFRVEGAALSVGDAGHEVPTGN